MGISIKRIIIVVALIMLSVFGVVKGATNAFPIKYLEYVDYYAKQSDIDPLFVLAIIKVESNFDEMATSKKGAKGLMQIMDSTALWANESIKMDDFSLYNPKQNIQIGVWYLKWLYDEYHNMDLVIAAYNAGNGNITKWLNDETFSKDGKVLESIPFEETSNYLLKVKFIYRMYKLIYTDFAWLVNLVNKY